MWSKNLLEMCGQEMQRPLYLPLFAFQYADSRGFRSYNAIIRLTWKFTDTPRKTPFLLERGFVHFHVI